MSDSTCCSSEDMPEKAKCCPPGVSREACCPNAAATTAAEPCCAGAAAPTKTGEPEAAFGEFMSKTFSPGALDVVQKELMTIALSVAVQCESCLAIHLGKAQRMGISKQEIEETAWMGVAFGGCKAMMFWKEHGGRTSGCC